ncbi:hypothetical protein [Phaeocystidibacter luteus]|nr:hypothetical protein [Phaeocystidibacter luteus]
MKSLAITLSALMFTSTSFVFNFTPESSIDSWRVVDDVVMG